MSKRLVGWAGLFLMATYSVVSTISPVSAEPPQSPNYRFDESTVGSGGLIQSNSANFQSSTATGDLAVGDSASGNFQVESGSKTTNDPTLSFSVNSAGADFGNFTASGASVTTATFTVSNYTSYGYVVQIVGTPPSNGNHVIPAMAATGASQSGVEQFGINLVANTAPSSVGANPKNNIFGVGTASPNYGTPNQYRYISGETIALAPKSSGETLYTLSYLVNVGSLTPGGKYKSDQTLIVTGTY